MMNRWILVSMALIIGLSGASALVAFASSASAIATGRVVLQGGAPASGAWVRPQTSDNLVYADSNGEFTLTSLEEGVTVTLTAWYTGHKTGWVEVAPPVSDITITLAPYASGDDPSYEWNTSYPDPANPVLGCGHCMRPSYDEWQHSAHAASGSNPRFFSLYNGTDISATFTVTPGYKLDFPGTAGNCAACHAPGDAYDAPFTTDMNSLSAIGGEGVFCEYCHKVGNVYLNPTNGLPYNNTPGVLSSRLYRPFPGEQLFFGSLDDVNRRVSYLPLEQKSQFCAPCHQFSFWGVPIYQSFKEWLESPYPSMGIECQTCHMPPGESPYFALPEKGGLARNPLRMASHKDLGLKDLEFMQNTVVMTVTTRLVYEAILVDVAITNTKAGHHVPTDHPGRHLILVVEALDGDSGAPLTQLSGPQVPSWGGEQAGLPGQAYAKVLQEIASGDFPVVSYWNPTRILGDNRIPALGSANSQYTFGAPQFGEAYTITARLALRRTFQAEMDRRGWNEPDIPMEEVTVAGEVNYLYTFFPLVAR